MKFLSFLTDYRSADLSAEISDQSKVVSEIYRSAIQYERERVCRQGRWTLSLDISPLRYSLCMWEHAREEHGSENIPTPAAQTMRTRAPDGEKRTARLSRYYYTRANVSRLSEKKLKSLGLHFSKIIFICFQN